MAGAKAGRGQTHPGVLICSPPHHIHMKNGQCHVNNRVQNADQHGALKMETPTKKVTSIRVDSGTKIIDQHDPNLRQSRGGHDFHILVDLFWLIWYIMDIMKNYYQQKKTGCKLEPVIYAKTVKLIRCYRHFQKVVSSDEAKTKSGQLAGRYIRTIDLALQRYVPEQYRDAVFAHLVDGVQYMRLEEKHYVSTSTMKRYVQVCVWGVAEELGESFPIEGDEDPG